MVQRCLLFIAYYEPKLTIVQLLQAISTPDTVGAKLDESNTVTERDIMRRCSSLIRKSEDGRCLEFAHFSVQEFLENETALLNSVSQPSLEAYFMSREIGEKIITAQCLRFVLLKNFDQCPTSSEDAAVLCDVRNEKFPFYNAATLGWLRFANKVWEDNYEDDFNSMELMKSLFHPRKTSNFIIWALSIMTTYYACAESTEFGYKNGSPSNLAWTTVIDDTFRPFHLAAALNIPELCDYFIESDTALSSPSQIFRAFEYAMMTAIGLSLKGYPILEPSFDFEHFRDIFVPSTSWRNRTIFILCEKYTALPDYSPILKGFSILSTSFMLATFFSDWTPTVILLLTEQIPSAADFEILSRCLIDCVYWNRPFVETELKESTLELLMCLNTTFVESDWGYRMCSMLWSWALRQNIVSSETDVQWLDPRITMSQDALDAKARRAIDPEYYDYDDPEHEELKRCLADPRFDLAYKYEQHDEGTLLHIAVANSAISVVQVLLDAGCDPYSIDKKGLCPLHHIEYQFADIVLEILKLFSMKGISLLSTDANGFTIWHLWGRNHYCTVDTFKHLCQLDREACETALKAKDHDGHTPLTLLFKTLIANRDDDEDRYFLDWHRINQLSKAKLVIRTSHNFNGFWELHRDAFGQAARIGSVELIEELLEADAPLDCGEAGSCTPLHQLGPHASVECLEALLSLYPIASNNRFRESLPLELYLQKALDVGIPPESGTLQALINSTRLYSTVMVLPGTIRLVKRYIGLHERDFISVLLKHRLDVHQRVDGVSCVEYVCSSPDARRLSCTSQGRAFLSELFHHTRKTELNRSALAGPGKGLTLLQSLLCDHEDCQCGDQCTGGIPWLIRKLVSQGVNLNSQCDGANQSTPLCHYLREGYSQYAGLLLDLGADPTLTSSKSGWDAVQYAVLKNNHAFLKKLQIHVNKHKITMPWENSFSAHGFRGDHPGETDGFQKLNNLHLASSERSVECLELLLHEEPLKNVNAKSAEGYTPLHFAAMGGRGDQMAVMRILLSNEADVSPKEGDGNTPLHFAAWNGSLPATEFLLDHGAVEFPNIYGKTPRCYALQQGHETIVQRLEASRSSLASQHSLATMMQEYTFERRNIIMASLLEQAIMAGDLARCKTIVSEGCPVDARMPKGRGISPLMAALLLEKEDICVWLLANGASVLESTDQEDRGVLEVAAAKQALTSVLTPLLTKYVSEGGDLVHGEDYPIHETILAKNIEGLKLLLGGIKDMHRTIAYVTLFDMSVVRAVCVFDIDFFLLLSSERGQISYDRVIPTVLNRKPECKSGYTSVTALHVAVQHSLEEAVSLLIEAGADVDAQDSNVLTPLAYARTRQMTECLLHLGASPTALIRWGSIARWTPLSYDMLSLYFGTGSGKTEWKLDDLVEIQQPSDRDLVPIVNYDVSPDSMRALNQIGVDLLREDASGRSLMHCIMCSNETTVLALRGLGLAETTPFPWHLAWTLLFDMAFITTKFVILKRVLPFKTFRRILNLEPARGWSPLCWAAALDRVDIIENCLSMKADIEFEGNPLGSALIVASVCGSLQAVRCLVRHGAAIAYNGSHGFTSALTKTRSAKIRAWLLVGRFTEVLCLTGTEFWRQEGCQEMEVQKWAGIVHARIRLVGKLEQRYEESIMMYAQRLAEWKKSKLGTVVSGV